MSPTPALPPFRMVEISVEEPTGLTLFKAMAYLPMAAGPGAECSMDLRAPVYENWPGPKLRLKVLA